MGKKQPYFANDWDMIADIDSEHFSQIPYEVFIDWRADSWELGDDYNVVIRATNTKTGKVKEYCYKQYESAHKKVIKLMESSPHMEVLVCDDDEMHYLSHS